ncbi:MAG: hypothetical protein IT574_09950 [Candidatus Aureabacteria bacterium]|nr:hypothetical protein [Candidatus Auribacterota bacterium]NLW93282.1 hypothetical protein [Chlamydiota bacterium]HOE26346.1 hypothetical protein [bacterium]HQM53170.1 hypothetical protein [bacterium]
MRRLLLAASFAFWAAMMSLVFQRHTAARRVNDDSSFLALVRGAPSSPARYLLRSGEQALGEATVSADADVVGNAVAYRLILRACVVLPALREQVSVDGEAVVRDPGGLSGFSLILRAGASAVSLRGTVSDDELRIERTGASSGPVRIPLPNAAGTVREAGEAVVEASGTFVSARKYIVGAGAGEAELWVDRRGGLLRADLPSLGFSAVREGACGGEDR